MAATPGDGSTAGTLLREDERRGVLFMLAGIGLFSLLNAVVKWQAETFPVVQILFFRNAFALPPILALVLLAGGTRRLRTRQAHAHVLHAVMVTVGIGLIFMAYDRMPLADATAINFAAPLIITALTPFLLREAVGWERWLAVLVGFGGVLLMAQPTGEGVRDGAVFAIAGTVVAALGMLLARYLSRADHSVAVVFYFMFVSTLLLVPLLPFFWITPTPWQLAGLVAMGLASGVSQYLTTRALAFASPAAVAPITYTKMLWAIVLGVLIFGDVPTPVVLVGSALVLGATWFVVHRSQARQAGAAAS